MGFRETTKAAWHKYRSWPTWVQIVLALVVLAAAAGATGESEDTPTNERAADAVAQESPDSSSEEEAAPSSEEDLRNGIEDAVGSSNRDVERISEFDARQGGVVFVEWAIDENLTEGLTKDTARLEATDILEAVQGSSFTYRRVALSGTFTLVDQLGNESEDEVVRGNFSRQLINKINFENFDFKNVFEIADSAYIHPAFQY